MVDYVWIWINDIFINISLFNYFKEIFFRDDLFIMVYVDMKLSIIFLSDFDEVVGYFELVGIFSIKWIDDIVFNDYEVVVVLIFLSYLFLNVFIFQDEVWKFLIMVFNFVIVLNVIGDFNYYVWIYVLDFGVKVDMEWFLGIVIWIVCNVDVFNYFWDI